VGIHRDPRCRQKCKSLTEDGIMLNKKNRSAWAAGLGVAALVAVSSLAPTVFAQRGADWEWRSGMRRLDRLSAGTFIPIRTNQSITSSRRDGRVYSGVVAEDVWDDYGRLAVPAIPRGSRVDLIVRSAPDNDLILDLEAIYAYGERYNVSAPAERIDSGEGQHRGNDRGAFVGGGAILGSVIGAITGGGKGAAIGAAAGAGAGLGMSYRGHSVRVPAGSVLTFRLDRPLEIATNGGQYHSRR
jgi:hypothetical protein